MKLFAECPVCQGKISIKSTTGKFIACNNCDIVVEVATEKIFTKQDKEQQIEILEDEILEDEEDLSEEEATDRSEI